MGQRVVGLSPVYQYLLFIIVLREFQQMIRTVREQANKWISAAHLQYMYRIVKSSRPVVIPFLSILGVLLTEMCYYPRDTTYIVGKTWFIVYFKLDFCRLHCTGSKNQVWNRLRIKFVQLDFWEKFQTQFFKNKVQTDSTNRAFS